MKGRISLDNGRTFLTASDAISQILEENLWDSVVNLMDDDVREDVHADLAPCSELEFLTEYLNRADEGIVVG